MFYLFNISREHVRVCRIGHNTVIQCRALHDPVWPQHTLAFIRQCDHTLTETDETPTHTDRCKNTSAVRAEPLQHPRFGCHGALIRRTQKLHCLHPGVYANSSRTKSRLNTGFIIMTSDHSTVWLHHRDPEINFRLNKWVTSPRKPALCGS